MEKECFLSSLKLYKYYNKYENLLIENKMLINLYTHYAITAYLLPERRQERRHSERGGEKTEGQTAVQRRRPPHVGRQPGRPSRRQRRPPTRWPGRRTGRSQPQQRRRSGRPEQRPQQPEQQLQQVNWSRLMLWGVGVTVDCVFQKRWPSEPGTEHVQQPPLAPRLRTVGAA